jgi:hypothetical protein
LIYGEGWEKNRRKDFFSACLKISSYSLAVKNKNHKKINSKINYLLYKLRKAAAHWSHNCGGDNRLEDIPGDKSKEAGFDNRR